MLKFFEKTNCFSLDKFESFKTDSSTYSDALADPYRSSSQFREVYSVLFLCMNYQVALVWIAIIANLADLYTINGISTDNVV